MVGKAATVTGQTLTPEQIGIGMRISIHPHTDAFVDVILAALEDTTTTAQQRGILQNLVIETGEVSTYVGVRSGKAGQQLAEYATTLIAAASRASNRAHLTSHLLLSRGCPGEAACELVPGEVPAETHVDLELTGLPAVAAWSLYPLADDGLPHMEPIMAAIEAAKSSGIDVVSEHYATVLRGDLAEVLALVVNAWGRVGEQVPHVVSHVSISLDSPSAGSSDTEAGAR